MALEAQCQDTDTWLELEVAASNADAVAAENGDEPARRTEDGKCSAGQWGPRIAIRVWVKIKPPKIGPQVLVHVSTYQDSILGTYF